MKVIYFSLLCTKGKELRPPESAQDFNGLFSFLPYSQISHVATEQYKLFLQIASSSSSSVVCWCKNSNYTCIALHCEELVSLKMSPIHLMELNWHII